MYLNHKFKSFLRFCRNRLTIGKGYKIKSIDKHMANYKNIDGFDKFKRILKQKGLRLTGARLSLYEFLVKTNHPLSTNKLVSSLAQHEDRASVYRNIELFEKIGIITKVYTGWKYRIELSEQFRPHHHHLTCSNCGRIVPISLGEKMEKAIGNFGDKHGFKITGHQIELTGLCSSCC